jgi:hypothetical protein
VSGGPLAPPLDTKEGLQRDGMYTLDQHHKLPSQSDPKCLALDSYFFRILLGLPTLIPKISLFNASRFGLRIDGEGESTGTRADGGGLRTAALCFWSRDPKWLISNHLRGKTRGVAT